MDKLLTWFKQRGSLIITLVLLAAIPLYPKFPIKNVSGTWVAIRTDDLMVLTAMIFWTINQLLKGWPIRKEKTFWLIVIFWLVGLISVLGSITISKTTTTNLVLLHWIRRVEYMSLFLIGVDAAKKERDLKEISWIFFVTIVGIFVFGYGQKYLKWPVISTMNEEFSKGLILTLDQWTRISSTFAGHYDLAVWLVMAMAFIPALIVLFKKKWQKLIGMVVFILSFNLLILTASRVSFVAYLIAITTTLLFLKKFSWIIPVVVISLFFGFKSKELNARLVSTLDIIPSLPKIRLSQRKTTPEDKGAETIIEEDSNQESVEEQTIIEPSSGTNGKIPTPTPTKINKEARTWPTPEEAAAAAARSSNIRFKVEWPRAIRAFAKNPLIGTGYSSVGLATDNDYLRMLAETGLMGTLSLLLVIFSLVKKAVAGLKQSQDQKIIAAAFLGIIVGFVSNAIFIDVFEASKVAFTFWLWSGTFYGFLTRRNNENK